MPILWSYRTDALLYIMCGDSLFSKPVCQGEWVDVGAIFMPDFCASVECPPIQFEALRVYLTIIFVWNLCNPECARLTSGLLLSTCEVAQGWCTTGDLRHPSLYTWTARKTARCSSVFKLTLKVRTPPTTCLWPKSESVNGIYFSEGPYKNQLSLLCFLAVAAVILLLLSASSRTWQWMLCHCKDHS